MTLTDLPKKLRKLADDIDNLLHIDLLDSSDTTVARGKIREHAGEKRKKLHWTQRPENKSRVKAMSKKAAKARKK